MDGFRKLRVPVGLAIVGALTLGCAYRSPVLMMATTRSTTNPRQLPLRCGVVFESPADYDPTSILTMHWALVIPTMFFYGQFPKPIEMEYVQDCVVDYLRDYNVFRYVYPYPFDPKDVDVVLRVRFRQLTCANNTLYSSGLPFLMQFVSFGALLVFLAPQEHFRSTFALEFELLKPPTDQVLTKYDFLRSGSQWVWMYQQPYAEYLWYNSVFREKFMLIMDDLRKSLEADAAKLVAAVAPRQPLR